MIPTFKNMRGFKYFFNIRSIFMQNYENYHAIIIDDFSNDGTATDIE